MGQIKRFNIKYRLWHILKEKFLKLEEIKEELIIKWQIRKYQHVKLQANLICITEPTGMKTNYIIEERS